MKFWYGSAVFFFVLGVVFFMLGMVNNRVADGVFAAGLMALFAASCWVAGFLSGPSRPRATMSQDQTSDSE